MKYIIITLIATSSLLTNTVNSQVADKDQYTIEVEGGVDCPFCAFGMEKKFKEFKAIESFKVDIETGTINFNYPSTNPLSIEKVRNQLSDAGYKPISMKITRADGSIESE